MWKLDISVLVASNGASDLDPARETRMTPIGLFRGEQALVTGSASNIGKAIAIALAREGATVRCVDIDAGRNATTVEEIAKLGGEAEAVTADLSTTGGWRSGPAGR